jgi:hypothetical protein
MDRALESRVWERAQHRCEYCHVPQHVEVARAEIDHIIAQIHGGMTMSSNLALSCFWCNRHKGPNLSGVDPLTRKITRLFHPRRHQWSYHFEWNSAHLLGKTAIGRTTVRVLKINSPLRVLLRTELLELGPLD